MQVKKNSDYREIVLHNTKVRDAGTWSCRVQFPKDDNPKSTVLWLNYTVVVKGKCTILSPVPSAVFVIGLFAERSASLVKCVP